MRFLLASLVIAMIVNPGCVYPTTGVRVADERPSIAVKGAPDDAVLYVDNLHMGAASNFDGSSQVLLLEPGTHKIEIKSQGRTIFSEKIFLGGGESKTLSVTGAGSTQ